MKILLADDQLGLHMALRIWSEHVAGITLSDAVTDLPTLRSAIEVEHPDVLLLDWELRGLEDHQSRRRLIAQLHAQNPMLQVVALSSLPDGRANALATGVDAFVSKTESPTELTALLLRLHETYAF